ncbi:hypothetical protein FNV43_RR12558 [Rhamnella rubrinervis]|uniref:HPP transmembrane region domain-containing protein n=1 Tax=Rhamnella rubrinervis TaxID=2594499 RepID=A0A8K0H7P0_9ROSA|nr:hypothetical protein FNV43_RR12558 [Rhamnella rubrinervis]
MGIQLRSSIGHRYYIHHHPPPVTNWVSSPLTSLVFAKYKDYSVRSFTRRSSTNYGTRKRCRAIVASSNVAPAPFWDAWKPQKGSASPSLSDILWPSAGAFAAMAILGKMDQMLAPKGVSMTIAPLGAVSAVLFTTPSSPAARKYNMFMAQIGCAAMGVLAFSIFGPGWLARSTALAASIAFMIYTHSTHPPAASLPLLFIDGAKFHHLNFWYALFPGAAGCLLLCLIADNRIDSLAVGFSSPMGYETRLSVGIRAGSPSSKQKMKSSPILHKLKIAKMDGVGLHLLMYLIVGLYLPQVSNVMLYLVV